MKTSFDMLPFHVPTFTASMLAFLAMSIRKMLGEYYGYGVLCKTRNMNLQGIYFSIAQMLQIK